MIDLLDITAKRAALTPDAVAFEDLATGEHATYRELDERAARAAGLLAARAVQPGDRIAVLCRNRIAFFELLFACGKLGTLLVPLNWRMPAAELSALVDDSQPRLLLHGREDAETAAELARCGLERIDLDAPGSTGYVALRDASPAQTGRPCWPADQAWYLLYTSGTTGKPKAVIQTYGMALANYVNIGRAIDLRNGDTTVNFLPLFHTAGINLHTLPVLLAGGRVLVMPGFDVDRMMRLLAAGDVDLFFGVPAVYRQMSLHPAFETTDFARVRHWGCGGAPLTDALVAQFERRGVTVCNGMGMTETGPTVFLADAAAARAKPGTVGRPQLLAAARIVDADGHDVPAGATGELWLTGAGITPGYWSRPEATRAAFTDDGWLRTGDLARCDGDGDFFIVGRLKDMFISGGENVYPAEIENVLVDHPDVLEAAVVGVPDSRWGEVGRAYVLARPGTTLDATVLTAFVRARVAPYKVPKTFVIVQDFPRTAAGKIQKHLLERNGLR